MYHVVKGFRRILGVGVMNPWASKSVREDQQSQTWCCNPGPSNGNLWLRTLEEFAGTSFGKIRFRIINCL